MNCGGKTWITGKDRKDRTACADSVRSESNNGHLSKVIVIYLIENVLSETVLRLVLEFLSRRVEHEHEYRLWLSTSTKILANCPVRIAKVPAISEKCGNSRRIPRRRNPQPDSIEGMHQYWTDYLSNCKGKRITIGCVLYLGARLIRRTRLTLTKICFVRPHPDLMHC